MARCTHTELVLCTVHRTLSRPGQSTKHKKEEAKSDPGLVPTCCHDISVTLASLAFVYREPLLKLHDARWAAFPGLYLRLSLGSNLVNLLLLSCILLQTLLTPPPNTPIALSNAPLTSLC